MASTRAGTMNVGPQSVAISFDGGVVVLPPQTQSAPIGSSSPSSGDYTSGSESSSWVFDEDDDVSTSDDDSGSEYAPSEDLDDRDAPLLSCTRGYRAAVTCQQAQQIRDMHSLSLSGMQDNLKHRIPHVMWQGGTPNFSYWSTPQPTVPQTPAADAADALLDEIYNGYHHITTLDLDDVANLSDLQSPTQPYGQGNPDISSTHPELDFQFDVPFVQPNWIDPYHIPPGSYMEHLSVCNVPLDSEDYPVAFHTLANSGLNFLTDYPPSESPRKGCFEITAILHRNELWNSSSRETVTIGQPLDWPTRLEKVSTRETVFVPFSYTNVWQPRTELMRATEGALVSPRAMPPMSPSFGVLFET